MKVTSSSKALLDNNNINNDSGSSKDVYVKKQVYAAVDFLDLNKASSQQSIIKCFQNTLRVSELNRTYCKLTQNGGQKFFQKPFRSWAQNV